MNFTFLTGDESNSVYNDLFSDTSLEVGKSLSKKEREDLHLQEEKSLIYGEVEFKSFYSILRKINPRPGLTFYDLGSGKFASNSREPTRTCRIGQ